MILSIITSIAIGKFQTPIETSYKLKLKSDVFSIRNAILEFKSRRILENNQNIYPIKLDIAEINQDETLLFNGYDSYFILKRAIISTNDLIKKSGRWSKISENSYIFYLNKNNSIKFTYSPSDATFNCNFNESLCREIER